MAKRVWLIVLLAVLGVCFLKPFPVFSEEAKVENTITVEEATVLRQDMKHLQEQTVREAEWAKTFNTWALTITGILLGILALVGIAFTVIYTRRIRDLTEESRDFRDRTEKSMEKAESYMERASAITQNLAKRKTEIDETFVKQEEIISRHVEQAVKKIDEEKEQAARFNRFMFEGAIEFDKEHFDVALKAFEQALKIDDRSPSAWTNKGACLSRLGRSEEGLRCHEKAIELEPNYMLALNNQGRSLGSLGRMEEALKPFNKVLELDTNNADALFNKSCAHSQLGQKPEMLEALERAIELDPESKEKAKTDEDFEPYREDPDFRKLVFGEEDEG